MSKPQPAIETRVCPGCDLKRSLTEYRDKQSTYRHCVSCRAKRPQLRRPLK